MSRRAPREMTISTNIDIDQLPLCASIDDDDVRIQPVFDILR